MNLPAHLSSRQACLSCLPFLLVAVLLSACGGSGSPKKSSDYELDLRPGLDRAREPDPETGLVTLRFALSLDEAQGRLRQRLPESSREVPEDPFAPASDDAPSPSIEAFQEALTLHGVVFSEGTGATYETDTETLTVIHTPEMTSLIESLLSMGWHGPLGVAIRFEFYEVPALLALRLEQSASAHHDHSPEWEALQTLLAEDEVRILGVATLQGKSGQRSKFEDGETVAFVSGYERDPDHPDAPARPILEERVAGTVVEMDPVIGPDDKTIDLNLALEFHTAPPQWRPRDPATAPAHERSVDAVLDTLPASVFHTKKVITLLTLRSGETKLLGSWRPTGDPVAEGKGLRHLVFLTAHVQRSTVIVP